MSPMLFQSRVLTHLIFADDLPVNYLLNAKGGCSTILEHLWQVLDRQRGTTTFAGDAHAAGPWGRVFDCTVEQIERIALRPTFAMVRNPYARALSGYLSKVGERKPEDLYIWNQFCFRFGLADDAMPTFDEYLEMIEREPLEMMDPHWAPQYYNLLQPVARIDRLFYLEDFSSLDQYLLAYFPDTLKKSDFGVRNAHARLEQFYTPSAIERVRRLYAADFETFGYSLDWIVQAAIKPISDGPGTPGGLTPMLKHMAAKDWQEKLVYLDEFERLSGSDYSTAMTRFCCGGEENSRMLAAERVLQARPMNWIVLRQIQDTYLAHNQLERAARFGAVADAAHLVARAGRPPIHPS